MAKSTYQAKIEALSKAASTLKIRGQVFEAKDDTVTIIVGTSLLEIPRKFILSMTEVEGAETKVVDVSINREAKIIQKTLVTPESAVGAVTGSIFQRPDLGRTGRDQCECLCQCQCRCECECCECTTGELGFVSPSSLRRSFRNSIRR